ncbi:MAG: hypothetical protein CW716_01175 [Candidatus Bathyarchaeum sp.]|nr:MAG: hypothetical protein CW716_01175 [Candidatus Bathyarchaeum sp.]
MSYRIFSVKKRVNLQTIFPHKTKPRLNAAEARHRLAPSEGQKEIARRTKPCRKTKGEKQND